MASSAFKASKIWAWLTGAIAVAVVSEESSDSVGKLSDSDALVTFLSTFILEKLLSALISAGAGSEKVNCILGDDTADGAGGGEGRLTEEASVAAASLS